METQWIPIRYRGFWDFPRHFVLVHGGAHYLFDCPFDPGTDEYARVFRIYQLRPQQRSALDGGSWENLAEGAVYVGDAPTASVRFDPTRREAVDGEVARFLA